MTASTMLLTLAKSYFVVFAYAIFFSSADGLMITSMIVEDDDLGILTNKSSTIYMVIGTFALLAASEEDSSAT